MKLNEGFQNRKFQSGTVKFSSSKETDPHIQLIAQEIAKADGISVQDVFAIIAKKEAEFQDIAAKAPTLYHTIKHNIVEDELFQLFQKSKVETNAAKISTTTFYKLVRSIRADHDEFFPLRSFIDKRRLINPKFSFVENNAENKFNVPTAAATPGGEFIFNTQFMQKLLDYAHLKQLKPNGKKYVSNGGDIPDEYCYIEFVIMHEFMHYSNDDFYYQKIIPNANPTIINWVGDFRSNYLLVKSGYQQLPIGLYNDAINYDRQKSYVEMYNIVKSEFETLNKDQQEKISQKMDDMSDDHKPGQQQGENADVPGDITEGDIDKNGKTIAGEMEKSKDASKEERSEKDKAQATDAHSENGQKGGEGNNEAVDYSKIVPTFNWKTLVSRFIKTAVPKMEETYSKPHRRNVTNSHIARQIGAGAVKPAERMSDASVDLNLLFVLDCSGSMISKIGEVFANARNLLKSPMFAKSEVYILKFSSSHEIYKGNFALNKARKITDLKKDMHSTKYDTTMQAVFANANGSGTEITSSSAADITTLLANGYNALVCSDTDILWEHNLPILLGLIKKYPRQMFIVMADRECYIQWRQKTGISTANISHF